MDNKSIQEIIISAITQQLQKDVDRITQELSKKYQNEINQIIVERSKEILSKVALWITDVARFDTYGPNYKITIDIDTKQLSKMLPRVKETCDWERINDNVDILTECGYKNKITLTQYYKYCTHCGKQINIINK